MYEKARTNKKKTKEKENVKEERNKERERKGKKGKYEIKVKEIINSKQNCRERERERERESLLLFVKSMHIYIYFLRHSGWPLYDKMSFFKQHTTGLNSEFFFSGTDYHAKVKENSLPYYLPIVGRRKIGCLPFSRVFALCEMQKASSQIWSRVTVSLSIILLAPPSLTAYYPYMD